MLVAGRCRIGWIRECPDPQQEPGLTDVLSVLEPERLDLVLVEGFKGESFPKIELHRPAMGRPLFFPKDPSIVAIATDEGELACDPGGLPRLSINDPAGIAGFILQFIRRDEGLEPDVAC
jgi:molybdopterin-guanine dinucleotide biosynthesis protein MobB